MTSNTWSAGSSTKQFEDRVRVVLIVSRGQMRLNRPGERPSLAGQGQNDLATMLLVGSKGISHAQRIEWHPCATPRQFGCQRQQRRHHLRQGQSPRILIGVAISEVQAAQGKPVMEIAQPGDPVRIFGSDLVGMAYKSRRIYGKRMPGVGVMAGLDIPNIFRA